MTCDVNPGDGPGGIVPGMRYAAYLCQPDGSHRDLEAVVEAGSPDEAARRAFELAGVHPDDEFPQILIVPDAEVQVFTRDDSGPRRQLGRRPAPPAAERAGEHGRLLRPGRAGPAAGVIIGSRGRGVRDRPLPDQLG